LSFLVVGSAGLKLGLSILNKFEVIHEITRTNTKPKNSFVSLRVLSWITLRLATASVNPSILLFRHLNQSRIRE